MSRKMSRKAKTRELAVGMGSERSYAARGRGGALSSIEETKRVNQASKMGNGVIIDRLNPSWYDRYPSISQVAIQPFMPYSSLATVLQYGTWAPPHVTRQSLYLGRGANLDAVSLPIGELWTDIRSKLKSNLAYTINDLHAYMEHAVLLRLVAKSAESALRIALVATAEDPTLLTALMAAKFDYSNQQTVLDDIASYGPSLRFALDNFATWMIENVPLHCSRVQYIDSMENNTFLENPSPNAPQHVFTLGMDVVYPDQSTFRYFERDQTLKSIISAMNTLTRKWPAIFITIAADLRNAYGDAINQAWDFDLKNYSFNPKFDPDVKQQIKNADALFSFVKDNSGALTNVPVTFPVPTDYTKYETLTQQFTQKLSLAVTSVSLPSRHFPGGIGTVLNNSVPVEPRQYLVTLPDPVNMGGEAIELTKHMSTFTATLSESELNIVFNNGTATLIGSYWIIVNSDGSITENVLYGNTYLAAAEVIQAYIQTSYWSEMVALSSVVCSVSGSDINVGCSAYDEVTAIPNINLDQMQYAATASLYRTVESF